jgi:hypothetical protein
MKMILAAALILLSCSAWSGEYTFQCTVKYTYALSKDGQLLGSVLLDAHYKHEKFVVNRKTGEVIGEKIPMFSNRNHQILWGGRNGNSFKLIYTSNDRNFAGYLEIFDWSEGEEKPFFLKDSVTVFTGICF